MHTLLSEERVDRLDRGVLELFDHHRLPSERDAASEAAADRQAKAPLHLLLEPLRGPGPEGPAALLDEQHRGGVNPEEIRDAIEQLSEQVVEVEIRERRLRHPLHVLQADDVVPVHRRHVFVVGLVWRHLCRSSPQGSQVTADGRAWRKLPGVGRRGRWSSRDYSVEMEGSAWTFSGMIIRKFALALPTRPMIRSASSV